MGLREHGTLQIDGPHSATGSQEVEWLLAICIEDAVTDAEISSFTRMAEARGQGAWLRRTAASLLDSVSTWRRGRGIALAALGDFTSEDFEPFVQALAADRSWLQWRRQDLIKWHEQNLWARHWFKAFLTAEAEDAALSTFRLFLRVVDGRFWLWRQSMKQSCSAVREQRLRFLAASEDEIEKRIESAERGRKDTFLGEKTASGEIYPFINGRPRVLADVEHDI